MNTLFFTKYAVVYTGHPEVITILFVMLNASVILFLGSIENRLFIIHQKSVFRFTVVISVLILIYIIVFPRMGEIGRLPAIEDWIERFLDGKFPYNSPHTPSSYPVIFLMAYPFYLMGNTGILAFLGIPLFFYCIYRQDDNIRGKLVKIIILLGSVVLYYEIVTRSELIFNIMLVSVIVSLSEKYLDTHKINLSFILTAIAAGLVLATRSFTALLFLIYFLYRFRFELKTMIIFGTISLLVFISFILPLYLWDPVSFMNNGPFAIQSILSNLPFILIALLFLAALYSGWAIADEQEFYFSGGVILFFAALVSFLFRVSEVGYHEALFNDGYDIAYFILCIPLLILSIKDYKTDRYLGKHLN